MHVLNCAALKPISDFKTRPPIRKDEKFKPRDAYLVASRVELVESISYCSAC